MVCCYLWLFLLYIDIEIGKMLTWLSLVMSMMESFCAVLFPWDVLDGI